MMDQSLIDALSGVARQLHFEDGAALRMRGVFASDLLLITEGAVDCYFSDDGDADIRVGPGDIVGEIGFLTGKGANATLRANGKVRALSINGTALAQLQRNAPVEAAQILQHLALLMRDRVEENAGAIPQKVPVEEGTNDVLRCSTLDQLRTAQKLRYDVYCVDFERSILDADPEEGTISDDMDRTGTSFLALHQGVPIGTARINLGNDTEFGSLAILHGLEDSNFALEDAALITRFAIREAFHDSNARMALFSAICGFVQSEGAAAIFLSCTPILERFYTAIGFQRAAPDFLNQEEGVSVPMVLYVQKYFARMSLENRVRSNHWH